MLANKYILDGKVYLVLFPLKYSLDKKPARINKFLNVISGFQLCVVNTACSCKFLQFHNMWFRNHQTIIYATFMIFITFRMFYIAIALPNVIKHAVAIGSDMPWPEARRISFRMSSTMPSMSSTGKLKIHGLLVPSCPEILIWAKAENAWLSKS